MIIENREGLLLTEATHPKKAFNPKGRLRWVLYGAATALLVPTFLLTTCQPVPLTSPSLAETVTPTVPTVTSLEQKPLIKQPRTVTLILQKILQPETYKSLTDQRLTPAESLPSPATFTPEDCQPLPSATLVNDVQFNFRQPPALLIYGEHADLDLSISSFKDNQSSNSITGCKVELLPQSIKQTFEEQFYPGLAFAWVRRPVGEGEMGSNPGIIKPLEGNNTYRVLIKPDMGISYAVWKNNASLPLGW